VPAEVPISYRYRTEGQSFIRLGPYLRKVVPAVWRMQRRHHEAPVDTTTPLLGKVNT